MINLRFQIVVLRLCKRKTHLHALSVGRLYFIAFLVQHLDVKGIGDCNICVCVAFVFNSLVHHALGRNRNALHREIGALREYPLRCANGNRNAVYCLGVLESRLLSFDLFPLGIDLYIRSNGHGKVKDRCEGGILIPAAEGEPVFCRILRFFSSAAVIDLL